MTFALEHRQLARREVTLVGLRGFARTHRDSCRCPHPERVAAANFRSCMAHLLPILQHHGLAAETSKQPPFTEVLAELDAYLADVKGLSDDSRRLTLRTIRLVLSAVMRGGRFDPARLTAPALQQHVADLAERRSAATDRSGDLSLPLQIGVLGLTHIFNCAVVYMGVALLARTVLRSRPGIARGVSCASGIAMIAIGVVLFAERLHS